MWTVNSILYLYQLDVSVRIRPISMCGMCMGWLCVFIFILFTLSIHFSPAPSHEEIYQVMYQTGEKFTWSVGVERWMLSPHPCLPFHHTYLTTCASQLHNSKLKNLTHEHLKSLWIISKIFSICYLYSFSLSLSCSPQFEMNVGMVPNLSEKYSFPIFHVLYCTVLYSTSI